MESRAVKTIIRVMFPLNCFYILMAVQMIPGAASPLGLSGLLWFLRGFPFFRGGMCPLGSRGIE
jgi:hypothetical protein